MGSQTSLPPLRLAILEADTPLPQTASQFHSYGGVFTDLFRRAVFPQPLDSVLSISTHHIVSPTPQYPDISSIDAILITGSKHNAFEDGADNWISRLVEFVRKCLEQDRRVKVIGVCFGHQVVARALGVPVGRSPNGWEVSVTPIQLSEAGRRVFGAEKKELKIHQMHRDAVSGVPAGAEGLGGTEVCDNQGFVLPGKALTVQGHPEFTGKIVREILDSRKQMGILSEQMYESGIGRVDGEHDGEEIARAFLRFLRE